MEKELEACKLLINYLQSELVGAELAAMRKGLHKETAALGRELLMHLRTKRNELEMWSDFNEWPLNEEQL